MFTSNSKTYLTFLLVCQARTMLKISQKNIPRLADTVLTNSEYSYRPLVLLSLQLVETVEVLVAAELSK